MARRQFTRHMTPKRSQPRLWLVYIGDDCSREEWVEWPTPDETFVRRKFGIRPDIPVLIGRA